ncbi:peptide methionine sulfoxide reductase MsrA-like [Oppia nitens]|uniref:peptide methionine sulfoxide reductase MsrA-like n=1 Tax=Oppia nitens TaxID=1686743 RepID=UPI0023DB3953|nr:peptide methionine sulfoxide reductase MsrA-like [Oppia nitens]
MSETTTSIAVFGLQCFWGSEVKFGLQKGVISTSVGYTGGSTPQPTYRQLGDHTEVVKVVFNDKLITYQELLDIFWSAHDPTYLFKQQYQSAIYTSDSVQHQLATELLSAKQSQSSKPIVTKIFQLKQYYLAEDYHQKYFLRKHPEIINELGLTDGQLVDSPVASRLNSYCAGFGSRQQFLDDIGQQLSNNKLLINETNQQTIIKLINDGPNLGEC